jgi:NAD(P)-dependent dehydrogenase (short-subunit alcohol dehydrogenase family)
MSALSQLHGGLSVLYGRYFVTLPVPKGNPELSKQTMIVTGANTGLGFESCLHLSRLGLGKLIMAVRTPSKGEEAKQKVLSATGQPESSIDVWTVDMDDYESVKALAQRASQLPRLDGVLANAGIMSNKYNLSEGKEKNLNVNVISTFLLYALLLPKMRESSKQTGTACRFSIPNSALHYTAPLAELTPQPPQTIMARLNDAATADMAGRYPLTKLLVIYAVRELAKTSGGEGGCVVNTPNPSFCRSGLAREMVDQPGFATFESLMARTTEEGSRTLVHGLLAPANTNGHYLTNCQIQTPARHVTSQWGQKVQAAFFKELVAELDKIQPGISSNL